VFELTAKRPEDKRKRQRNPDPSDIEGYLGPWGKFVDEQTVMKPNEVKFFLVHLDQRSR
jgi:pre-mRNA-processing factor 17